MKQLNLKTLLAAATLVAASSALLAASPRVESRSSQSTVPVKYLVRRGAASDTTRITTVEGTVTSVTRNAITIRTTSGSYEIAAPGSVPVTYGTERYTVEDLETGDYIRVSGRMNRTRGFQARSIDVIRSVSDDSSPSAAVATPHGNGISGEVIRIDDRTGVFRMRTDDGATVTVDAFNTREFRRGASALYDLRSGDRITASGSFVDRDTFRADSLHLISHRQAEPRRGEVRSDDPEND